jgi:transcriptional regulator with XRE-family HTH domain
MGDPPVEMGKLSRTAADNFYWELGRAIRRAREDAGQTQSKLAAEIGLSRTALTNIELGRQRLLVDQLCSIANSLEVDTQVLINSACLPRDKSSAHTLEQLSVVSTFIRSVRQSK